jgi:hypothetical protein
LSLVKNVLPVLIGQVVIFTIVEMTVSKEQLIDALYNEYVFLCHDDFDPDEDATPEEYLEMLKEMSYDELVEETQTDDIFTIDEFMNAWA